ncbi:MAG: UDP-N-acetylmuramoyl-L-alanine--D-glutamate ligase [Pseudomonadota bacterium]|nr:UDP-N-acetylmuramoyl-L-alanine--D-glutamate ligase [Pseudomonadota bacterium]
MNTTTVIMGLGTTGLACARFLAQQGIDILLMDNRPSPPGLATIQQTLPHIPYITGYFDAEQLAQAREIIISPGVALSEPSLAAARAAGVPIISEIELFARYVNAAVIAITGSNGKSTVTTLVGMMAEQAGWHVQVGGNLGVPALELLTTPAPDLYVLELSSFQLETTYSLNPKVAVILNISADHMDRYPDLAAYCAAKQRIFQGEGIKVINFDDPQLRAMLSSPDISFSLECQQATWAIGRHHQQPYIIYRDAETVTPILPTAAIYLPGAMMRANVLAALALGHAAGLPLPAMLDVVQTFKGLPHRCAWVTQMNAVDWFNDSKGTNVGATIAAIEGLERPGQVILIAGGDGKGADFSALAAVAQQQLKAAILIGRDAPLIARALTDRVPLYSASTMQAAVHTAVTLATAGDAVLLSPACASFDMFTHYRHRGEVFETAVKQLQAGFPLARE